MSSGFRRSLAATAATTLASSRLLGRARRELTRARALRSVTKELTGTLDLTALLREVVELTRTLFDADMAGFGRFRPRASVTWPLSTPYSPFSSVEALNPLRHDRQSACGIAAITLYCRAASQLGQCAYVLGRGVRALCLVPLVARQPLGFGPVSQSGAHLPQERSRSAGLTPCRCHQNARLYVRDP